MINQQHGSRGIVGRRYAASFYGHDGALGKAISPEFPIDKDYLHFKVAGGRKRKFLEYIFWWMENQSIRKLGKRIMT